MDKKLKKFYDEIDRYSEGVHRLNDGIDYESIDNYEKKYGIYIPNTLKEFLQISNGGELFALPVGIKIAGILGEKERRRGIFYLEDNFDASKRVLGMPSDMFILADLSDGEIVGFDLSKCTLEDGRVIQWDPESAKVISKWKSLYDWLNGVMEEGTELFDYEGNDI